MACAASAGYGFYTGSLRDIGARALRRRCAFSCHRRTIDRPIDCLCGGGKHIYSGAAGLATGGRLFVWAFAWAWFCRNFDRR